MGVVDSKMGVIANISRALCAQSVYAYLFRNFCGRPCLPLDEFITMYNIEPNSGVVPLYHGHISLGMGKSTL